MSDPQETTDIRHALWELDQADEGAGRNARAERLLERAEATGDRPLLVSALFTLMKAYNYSSEKDKAFVPYARALRMWDERPEDFDDYNSYRLHWMAKWVSSGMLDQPHIPLAAIEKWQTEMEHRYRLAGYSERAVRQGEHRIARHLGDEERAQRAFEAWLAADRDRMADCHACELHGQGWWQQQRGLDAEALVTWAPVLAGTHTCLHEPHATLASSLLPLVRLGRPDEARANHLRGYRMVRPMESMRGSVASHIEFCALTGNEARGLEILAERPAYLTDDGEPDSLMDYLAVTSMLMRRLTALGHGAQSVTGPAGREWTAAELAGHAERAALDLAARFDERNGTTAVSGRVRLRIGREPLVERLPLGVRAARLAAPETPVVPEVTAPVRDFAALLAEARRLSEALDPDADRAWAAAEAAARREGAAPGVLERAEFAAHRAAGPQLPDAEAVELLRTAAGLYEEAGEKERAAATRGRAAYALALAGDLAQALAESAAALADVRALHEAARDDGAQGARHLAGALLSRARVLATLVHREEEAGEPPSPEDAARESAEVLGELLALTAPYGDDVHLAARASEAHLRLGDLAAHSGDPAAAAAGYRRAAQAAQGAGLHWLAVQPQAQLAQASAQSGDLESAEQAALAALEHGARLLTPLGYGQLHNLLAEVYADTGRLPQAAEHTLQAAHWADEAGLSEGPGAWSRFRLGGLYRQLGRTEEAAAVLEAALVDLSAAEHGEGALVQTRWWLGELLLDRQEFREAAEHFLLAAEIAKDWPEQIDHARLAHLAAGALQNAGMQEEAGRAFERAGELWRTLGDTVGLVKTLRARAWLAAPADGDEESPLMDEAVALCAQAYGAAADDAGRALFADTLLQAAELHSNRAQTEAAYERALSYAQRAIALHREAGDAAAASTAELAAGWIEVNGCHSEAAAARARRVLAAEEGAQDGQAEQRRAEARELLEYVGDEE
ncbi:tetratricopeptide repeat protein [Streptomyces polyrhachis]|uniref:Tetratricopeptide repeat protein n=1 Tax=Streptomyces polyrhachis TaxID=1282885 RepID=A0ABW2GHC3_9ACTN